ncbi:Sjogren's syndrome/scleroderma autoantigen 1 family protein [Methanolobus psychrotolerans]|uniref:Sjogren's syndrome/scleroderma autoantigen 1 family protein n=1 Tax=Methanolobus psychrotolerans TaxID=1874706 RepID=UPI000B915963|nr:Sjogren's syndrome/scleroderma autoantigen 1 family protein [Methanolobus psychrotolerans]
MSNTDDENIQKISRMLEIGGTMLAQHCDNCGAPLFRYQGRVLCPVCEGVRDPRGAGRSTPVPTPVTSSKPEISPVKEKEQPVAATSEKPSLSANSKAGNVVNTAQAQDSVSELESLMLSKMLAMARDMQDETDARRITDYLNLIDHCMDIMAKMHESL